MMMMPYTLSQFLLPSSSTQFGNDFVGLLPPHRRLLSAASQMNPYDWDLSDALMAASRKHMQQQQRHAAAAATNKEATIGQSPVGKDGFQISIEVEQFKPSELEVKVVNNAIIVEGKHEEREDDHGYISRHFVRRYTLPQGYDANKVVSTLSSDGVLTVSVPKPQIEAKRNERIVQIQQTGPAHLNVKPNAAEQQNNGADAANGGDKAAAKKK